MEGDIFSCDLDYIEAIREMVDSEGVEECYVNIPRVYRGKTITELLDEDLESIWFYPLSLEKSHFDSLSDREILELLYANSYTMQ